jgi:DNA-binding Lrp family transcriptional regulator
VALSKKSILLTKKCLLVTIRRSCLDKRMAAPPKPIARPARLQGAPQAAAGPRDEVDRALIALLQANARESAANLARKLGVARTTVLARQARLERDRVLVGYTALLGQDLNDTSLQAYVGISVQPRAGRAVEQRLSRMPELRQLCTVAGEFDYIALIRAESAARLDALLDEIGGVEGVSRTTTSVVLARRIDRQG